MKFPGRVLFILLLSFTLFSAHAQYRRVMAAEYYWDTDPGQGNGTAMAAVDGSFSQAFESISLNTSALPSVGVHKLCMRVQDSTGIWGTVFSTVVNVQAGSISFRADNIIAAEYFWDTDPGLGNASAMIAFDGNFNQAFEAISKSNATLPAIGKHTLSIRAQDVAGNWGTAFTTVVEVLAASTTLRSDKIIAGEYFWDTDPGQGGANVMVAFDGAFDQAFEAISKSNASLPATGMHTLNVRTKDVAGNWGPIFTTVVEVEAASTTLRADKIIAGEYFWDTDPGQGSANALVAFDGAFDQAFEAISKSNAALPATGMHTLNVRTKDVAGNWGSIFTTVVQVQATSTSLRTDKIIAGEYFWDTDPGQGSANVMIAFDGAFDQAFEAISKSNAAPPGLGMHTLNVRGKDAAGNWGAVFTVVVQVQANSNTLRPDGVIAAEYFFDTDPGQGNATPMLAQGGSFGADFQGLLGGSIPTPVTAGIHLLSMRAKDAANNWGRVFSVVVNVDTTIGAPNVHIAGYSTLCSNNLAGAGYSTPFVAGTSYVWSITGGTITSGAGTNSVSVTWNGSGPYKLVVAGCDTTSHLCSSDSIVPIVKPVSTTTINRTICQGQSFAGYSATGTFVDTYTGANGCDSIRTLNLTVLSVSYSTLNHSICQGQAYLGHNTTGTYVDTLTASNGCDSIRTLILTVLNVSHTSVNQNICQGQSYYGHNTTGTFIDTLTGSNGCDSIRTLNLTVLAVSYSTLNHSMCQGQTYFGHSTSGTYIDTIPASNGCDSIRTLILTVLNVSHTSVNQNICQGQSYYGHSTTGTFIDTLTGSNGCDSIRTLSLTVLGVSHSTINQSICQGQTYLGHSGAGTYIDTLTASNGCDSIRSLQLTVLPIVYSTVNRTVCHGQSYAGHNTTGTFIDTLTAAGGCDSIRSLNLIVLPAILTTINQSICSGQSYAGHSTSGTYVDTYTASNGCDSTRTLNLTVTGTITITINKAICPGQFYAGHNTTGTYIDTFTATGGCDSIRTLNLIILPTLTTSDFQTICGGHAYGGHNSSGTFVDTLTSSFGCDSIRTLHLMVISIIRDTIRQVICQGDTFEGHTSSGNFTDTLTAVTGCDSIITLQLTVNPIPAVPTIIQHGDTLISTTAMHYQWYRDSVIMAADTNKLLVITQNGNYAVVARDSFGCSSSSVVVSVLNVNVAQINGIGFISIFPNPVSDVLNLHFSGLGVGGSLVIKLCDAIGQTLIEKTQLLLTDEYAVQLPCRTLAQGIYFVNISTGDEPKSFKILKQD